MSFSPDGRSLVTNDGPLVCVIDPLTRAEKATAAVDSPVGPVACSPEGARIAVANGDNVDLWRAESLGLEGSLRVGPVGAAPLWSGDSAYLGIVVREGLELLSARSRRLVARATLAGARVLTAAAHPAGRRFVYGTEDGTLGILALD